jgi:hypothetical protein
LVAISLVDGRHGLFLQGLTEVIQGVAVQLTLEGEELRLGIGGEGMIVVHRQHFKQVTLAVFIQPVWTVDFGRIVQEVPGNGERQITVLIRGHFLQCASRVSDLDAAPGGTEDTGEYGLRVRTADRL